MLKNIQKSLRLRLALFTSNREGVAAVEFAYIVPLLMLMTFGTFEIARALIVHKRFQRATAMVGDLVAREYDPLGTTSVQARSALKGILKSAEHVVNPYSSAPLKLNIYQLWASTTDATKTKIEWSYLYPSGTSTSCGTTKAMPSSGMVTAGGRAILVESEYTYTPLLTNIIPGLIKQYSWKDTMTFAPRNGTVIFMSTVNNTDWASPSTAPCS